MLMSSAAHRFMGGGWQGAGERIARPAAVAHSRP